MKTWLILCCTGAMACAEVRSLTLGIDVNSPYGLGEPWITIRDGLLRLDSVESVSPQADRNTSTGEMRTKGGRVPNVEALTKALRDLGAGASLRGIEADVLGRLEKQAGQFVLRVSKTDEVLLLEPVRQRVHLQARRKSPEPLTESEQKSFQKLAAMWQGAPLDVRITGPISQRDGKTFLSVRNFDLQAATNKQNTK